MIDFDEFIKDRIIILDGAIGTMIKKRGLTEKDFRMNIPKGYIAPFAAAPKELKNNYECLNFTRPELISEIHREYIEAGARIIESNTFNANRISQKEYGLGDFAYEMAKEGASIARKTASSFKEKILVAGSAGPTSKSLTLGRDINKASKASVSFEEMEAAYQEQIRGLIDGGADIIMLETCFDSRNTEAALRAIEKCSPHFPVMVSISVNDKDGRTLTGESLESFYEAIKHHHLLSFGINSSFGAKDMIPLIQEVADFCELPVSCHPNAEIPDERGEHYDKPWHMASELCKMAENGIVNILGGSWGSTPEHICAINTAVTDIRPRELSKIRKTF